jgi:type II secretory pathway predicted ATPase ExeA
MPRHFLDLQGAATVATEPLRLTHRAVADLRRARAMGVVHGDAGLGKTFAVEDAMLTSTEMAEACWMSVASGLTLRQLSLDLLGLLTRRRLDTTRYNATYELIELLAERPRLLVLDESQRLSSDGIELLRHLHDHPATQFALLLVGGNGCWEVLSREPMLRSRIYRRIHFQPLSPQQVLQVLPGYHPLYAQTDPDLLSLVDESYAHGNRRAWASFTHTALELATQTGRAGLDEPLVRNVFALQGGVRLR